jgi:hypothetical protein
VRAQVDRDLTTIDYFDRLLGLIKNLTHHTNQGIGSLFIGTENLADLACRSCSIPRIKRLPTFVKVVEGCVIFNFALDHKVHFSLKIQRKFIFKTASTN